MRKQKRLPAVLNRYEQYALLKQPNPKAPTGLRNLCIISLMLKTGLRVNEIIDLKDEDIDWDNGRLHVRKSGAARERVLWVDEAEIFLLRKWRALKAIDSEQFFSTLDGNRLKDRYIREMVKRLARKAGITKDVYPHLLRYTFAVDLIRETKDIHILQEALGHRKAAATQIYSKLLIEELTEPCFSDSSVRRSGMPALDNEQKRFSVVEKTVNKPDNGKDDGKDDQTTSQNNPAVKEQNKDLQEPPLEIVAEASETIRKPIPAIKCSQCNFVLRFQGDCPQCGTPFTTIINHWRKNI